MKPTTESTAGIQVDRLLTTEGVHPYEQLEWETCDVKLGDFEQEDVEFPASWSMNARQIVANKYFRGHVGTPERERSARQMVDRVALTLGRWGREHGHFAAETDAQAFEAELTHILINQLAAFNSPVWFNVGHRDEPQVSACQPYRALVSTPDGMVPIGEIVEDNQIGREVYDADGTTKVLAVKKNGRKPVYRVQLRNGSFVEATADHVVKADINVGGNSKGRGRRAKWARVDELEPGMALFLQPHRARTAAPVGVGAGGKSVEGADERLRAEAALAGWLQADGCVAQYPGGSNPSLIVEFQVATDEEFEWITENLGVAMPDEHYWVREADTIETRVRRIRLSGKRMVDFVDRWELRARGVDIRVPSRLWDAPADVACAYLTSVFQADGYVTLSPAGSSSGTTRIAIGVISPVWLEDIQILLGSLGIYSRRTGPYEDRRPNRKPMQTLGIGYLSERKRFSELIGFLSASKRERLALSLNEGGKALANRRAEEIISVTSLGTMDVYDIQTESGEYLTNNVEVHNCFLLSVEDSMPAILNWNSEEGMIFKGGSGAGVNLSKIRGSNEPLSMGGIASGPVSFMRGADAWAGSIKSGGGTRRAAKLVRLDDDHPDILEFIDCKAAEEDKALALAEAGFDMSIDGDGFRSIQYQNANNSVGVSDAFMRAVENDDDWALTARTTGEVVKTVRAREMFERICKAAWRCADPGLQFRDTMARWHATPADGPITTSNPCGEFCSNDNTACNLASLNLMRFRRDDGTLDVETFTHVARIVLLAQEIIVSGGYYPTEKITANAKALRQLGLGYTNLGAYLMANGLPYDSPEGRAIAAAITHLLNGTAIAASAGFAERVGPYERFADNRDAHLAVIEMHRAHCRSDVAGDPLVELLDPALAAAAMQANEQAVELSREHGMRNAQVTLLAPTGTVSFLLDADTTGVEPDLSLVKVKALVGGGTMTIVNGTVALALSTLGYTDAQIEQIEAHINEHATIIGAPELADEHLPVFDVAVGERAIAPIAHVRMVAAVQPALSGAVSKTINMPAETTVEDIHDVYMEAWRLGCKGIAIYRDGSKTAQALYAGGKTNGATGIAAPGVEEQIATAVAAALETAPPRRRRMGMERPSITHKFSIAGHEGYITAGMHQDGSVGEIFLTDIGKEGSTLRGMMNAFATAISIALQYGVPLEKLVEKFSYMRFDPEGMTQNPEIPFAKSLPDYILRWLASRFLEDDVHEELGILTPPVRARKEAAAAQHPLPLPPPPAANSNGHGNGHVKLAADGHLCPQCQSVLQHTGACETCPACGFNTGCG